MEKYFKDNHVYSAATSLLKPTSKPNPAIYLHACKGLGVTPAECVAVKDSRSGATAAKNAKIPLIGHMGPYTEKEDQDQMYDMLKNECGAIYVMRHWDEFPKAVETV
jgi:beta-phosphoglucomutase-like phosphatase (HAD superfamily)